MHLENKSVDPVPISHREVYYTITKAFSVVKELTNFFYYNWLADSNHALHYYNSVLLLYCLHNWLDVKLTADYLIRLIHLDFERKRWLFVNYFNLSGQEGSEDFALMCFCFRRNVTSPAETDIIMSKQTLLNSVWNIIRIFNHDKLVGFSSQLRICVWT
jgi:hypothetical protein